MSLSFLVKQMVKHLELVITIHVTSLNLLNILLIFFFLLVNKLCNLDTKELCLKQSLLSSNVHMYAELMAG